MPASRTIGLLGGMSLRSSLDYERIINSEVQAAHGGVHSASLLVRSYDFAEIERLQAAADWEQAGIVLAGDARRLQDAGAGIIVLCTDTMHRLADIIEGAIGVPFLQHRRRDRRCRPGGRCRGCGPAGHALHHGA